MIPKSADVVWYLTLACLGGLVLASLMGCASLQPRTEVRQAGNIPYLLHIDHDSNPCDVRKWADACYQGMVGVHQVWVSSMVPAHILEHKEAHVRGMRHTEPWVAGCVTVTKELLPRYPLNARICATDKRETVT